MLERRYLSISEQVADHLRDELLRGRWREFMPGLPRLSQELGIDPKTVDVALKQLEQQGLIERQGAGKRRRILVEAATATTDPSIRVAILSAESLALNDGYMIELLHRLHDTGHHAFFAPKTLEQLNMNLGRLASMVRETPADAWVVSSASREVLEWFMGEGIPVFALFGRRRELKIAGVGPDKVQAFRDAVRALVALGHRRISLLALRMRRLPKPGAPERAFLQELEAQGLPTGPYNLPDWEENSDGLHELLDSIFRVTPPTALIIDQAYIFHAVKHHLANLGVKVPGDVSLICTDPDTTFAWCKPTIAHIVWDSRPVLRRIIRWASNVSRGKQDLRQSSTPARLIPGGTIGPAKKGD
jgi:DNA-binding LacI/PurR family transcriptional regulator